MELKEIIELRRSYRSLAPMEITSELIRDLAYHACLAPSCYNNQPWRFIFTHSPELLSKMWSVLSQGNEWAKQASMIVTVFSEESLDCRIKGKTKERQYYMFDTGMGTAFLILRATELGLVAHPIAGFKPSLVKEILNIPEKYDVITLLIVGKVTADISSVLDEKQVKTEKERPIRLPFESFAYVDTFQPREVEGSTGVSSSAGKTLMKRLEIIGTMETMETMKQ